MAAPFPHAMAEQPRLWEQNDLLSLLAQLDSGQGPAAAEPEAPEVSAAEPTQEQAPPVAVSDPSTEPEPQPEPPLPAAPASPLVQRPESVKPEGSPGRSPTTLLILDTETTGLDPSSGHCLEVGAVLFHVPGRAVLGQLSFLLPAESNPARHVNGIDPGITQLPQPWRQSLELFGTMVDSAEAVLAHNAAFDRQWFGIDPLPAIQRPWICSMEDIRWPADRHLRATPSVRDLALAYGVPVWAAHRALTDCIYLVQVFERCPDLEDLLVAALEPRQLFRAQLSYAERHQAKEAGFRWNDPVAGAWTRRLSESEVRALPFPVQPVSA